MKALYQKLSEYLQDEYCPEEIISQISSAKIRAVKSDYVEVVWSSGILECLELDENGNLFCKNGYSTARY